MKLLLLLLPSVVLAANLTALAENYPGPIMNTNSVTQRLEPYTAVYEGRMFVYNIQPTDVCINSFGRAGTAFDTNSTYALEVGAIAPSQTKTSRASYDKGALYFKLVSISSDNTTVNFGTIEALSSFDNGANKGSGPWGMYWQTSAVKNDTVDGYNIEGKYVWTDKAGNVGGIPRPTCKGTYWLSGDNFDDTWNLNGTLSIRNARWTFQRRTVRNGVLVQNLIWTFDGNWLDNTAKLQTNGTTVQTEGQWAGFKVSGAVKTTLSGGWTLVFGIAIAFMLQMV